MPAYFSRDSMPSFKLCTEVPFEPDQAYVDLPDYLTLYRPVGKPSVTFVKVQCALLPSSPRGRLMQMTSEEGTP